MQGAEAWVRKERGMCDEGGEGIGEEKIQGWRVEACANKLSARACYIC